MDIYPDTIVYIMAPGGVWTGGPNSCHQLCRKLRLNKINAYIYYYYFAEKITAEQPSHPNALVYGNPVASEISDNERNIVICPETAVNTLIDFKRARKAIWWLSADGYHIFMRYYARREDLGRLFDITFAADTDITHFTDSHYARRHAELFSFPADRVFMLESYIHPAILKAAADKNKRREKRDIVTYNPAPMKGWETILTVIDYCRRNGLSHIKFIPLSGFTQEQLCDVYRISKLHLVMDRFTGREYIPREASIFDMCVITRRHGCAKYAEDVPIPEKYKFDVGYNNLPLPQIAAAIKDCVDNYEEHIADFREYKDFSLDLERRFTRQVRGIFKKR